jgi:hypothetical protein
VLRAILEEPKGAVAKVKQHACTTALLVAACHIAVFLAVAPEGSIPSTYESAICTITPTAVFCGIKFGPANADEDV